jgi:ankyrin repeat protein
MIAKVPKKELLASCGDRHVAYAAVSSGSQEVIEELLPLLEDINVSVEAKTDRTVAHVCALNGLLHLVEFLWKVGVDFTRRSKTGETAVELCIRNNDSKMLKKILKLVPFDKHNPNSFRELANP